jgi:hypothetical protein
MWQDLSAYPVNPQVQMKHPTGADDRSTGAENDALPWGAIAAALDEPEGRV